MMTIHDDDNDDADDDDDDIDDETKMMKEQLPKMVYMEDLSHFVIVLANMFNVFLDMLKYKANAQCLILSGRL
eukprot:1184908-Amphidinium_carterae.1